MAISTTTLLEAVNTILRNVGERTASSTTATAAAEKAKTFMDEAWLDHQYFVDWSWQRDEFTPTSWDSEKVTFSELKRITSVRWDNDSNINPIAEVDYTTFYNLGSLSTFTDNGGSPVKFCVIDEDTIAIEPYPTDVTGQARLSILGYKLHPLPASDTDTFDCPESHILTIIKKATAIMLQRHLGEVNEAQALEQDYLRKLQILSTKDVRTSVSGINMFRRFDREVY